MIWHFILIWQNKHYLFFGVIFILLIATNIAFDADMGKINHSIVLKMFDFMAWILGLIAK